MARPVAVRARVRRPGEGEENRRAVELEEARNLARIRRDLVRAEVLCDPIDDPRGDERLLLRHAPLPRDCI